MIHVIMGLKGTGKTKKMIEQIQNAVEVEHGNVVCIEYGKQLTYNIDHRVRLVDSEEYGVTNSDMLKGLLCGLHAGNFDITHIFIDNLYKTIGRDLKTAEEFVFWCDKFAQDNKLEITVTVSDDPTSASEEFKKYL